MRYTLTLLEHVYIEAQAYFQTFGPLESAGYIFARISTTENEVRLIGRSFVSVDEADVLDRSEVGVSIDSKSFMRALRHADETQQCFIFVHSHPGNFDHFSEKDDREEPPLFRTAYIRAKTMQPHASVVFQGDGRVFGRVWLEDGAQQSISRIRVIGDRIRFFDSGGQTNVTSPVFDRQVRAFGKDMQRLLGTLRAVVAGAGGTGSATCEQLMRLGIGHIDCFDPQALDLTNVNRVYGSGVADEGTPKVELVRRNCARIGVGTTLEVHQESITSQKVAKLLRRADVIFGCTDDEFGRSILDQIALRYAIPVFDMAVKIDSKDQQIIGITGRVTVLSPGQACLLCRERITAARITADALRAFNAEEAAARRKEGYAPELDDPDPAVVSFTTAVAAQAVTEFLQRLTGFMGESRRHSETILNFCRKENIFNRQSPDVSCDCGNPKVIGVGDQRTFLDRTWA